MNKPGFKTSEFWLSVAASIVSFLFASGIVPVESTFAQVLGFVAMALSAMGYSVARSITKSGEAKAAALAEAAKASLPKP